MDKRYKVKAKCKYCGNIIIDYKCKKRQYCNLSCKTRARNKKYNKEKVKKECLICNRIFWVVFSRKDTAKYCSRKCHGLSRRGKKPSNLGELMELARLRSQERKGKTLEELYGKAKANEILRKMSGENSGNWKDGATPKNKQIWRSEEMKEWRKSVFGKNSYTCQKCREKGGKLQPHHILNFSSHPDLRFAIDNGITFCKECHTKFHKIYGKQNNTREQLEDFLKIKIQEIQ